MKGLNTAWLALLLLQPLGSRSSENLRVNVKVDAARSLGEMRPIWAFFGYDEPNYTYMKDGAKLLSQLAALSPVPVYVRAHNLLTSGDGTPALKWGSTNIYTEEEKGQPRYDWKIVDRIFDTYVERGMKPMVEIGFMPEALSVRPRPYRHNWPAGELSTGWAYPPTDYAKWAELVFQWVRHCVARYGRAEVETWLWELWNEPNISYWRGTPEEFYRLYDFTADAVKRALPEARFGGPHAAGSDSDRFQQWLRGFLDHVVRGANSVTGKTGSPIDFVAFHAKGSPRVVDGRVRMGISNQLATIRRGFDVIASYPELRDKPVILGESDPEGCAACSARTYPQNAYRNGTMYSSYTAAVFARKYDLAGLHRINLAGAVTWAFEFEDQPWFDGFRDLATNGVEKPVLNIFRMFGLMGGDRIHAESTHAVPLDLISRTGVREQADVAALASRGERRISILIWHYHDDDLPGTPATVDLRMDNLPANVQRFLASHFRIDGNHSNSYEAWKKMGSPPNPDGEQVRELQRAARLTLLDSPAWVAARECTAGLTFELPRQGVSLLQLTW